MAEFNNETVAELKKFLQITESDAHCIQEVGLNWSALPRDCKLKDWFQSENESRVVTAHNKHGHHGCRQWGGTAVMVMDHAASAVVSQGVDDSGLGRWSWILFQGANNHRTCIISACRPCKSRKQQLRMACNQHRRHFRASQRDGCPRQLFVEDLQEQLLLWRSSGEKLIVCIDGNEDVRHGPLKDMFACPESGMQEVISGKHPALPPTASFCAGDRTGRVQIDGVWATPDLPIDAGTWLAIGKAPGDADHRHGIVDIKWEVLLGQPRCKAVRPAARWLNCSHPHSGDIYIEDVEHQFEKHKILEKLHAVCAKSSPRMSGRQGHHLEKIDKVKHELMIGAENRCRKTPMGAVDFTPKVNKARKLCRLWRLVVAKREGKKRSSRNIRHLAKSCSIKHPLSVTLEQARQKLACAEQQHESIKPQAPLLRNKWLRERAKDETSPQKARHHARKALRIEEQRTNARRIKQAMGKRRAGAISKVEVRHADGTISAVATQDEVEAAVMQNNEARFRLTEPTPFMQEPLRSEAGFFGATEAAQQMLDGTHVCPAGTDPFTQYFVDCLKAADHSPVQVNVEITADDCISHWNKVKEMTSSSCSGLHFSHWKAATRSRWLSEIHALSVEIACSRGYSCSRWQAGLSAMLEKKAGIIQVDKLRAILLMEADFNFANKLIFGSRMMKEAMAQNEIPDELFGSIKNWEAVEAAACRRSVADLSRMMRTPMAISSVDAQTCCDRMVHSIASICCQRWNAPKAAIISALGTIQKMKFYLRTSCGDSTSCCGGGEEGLPFQGGCQGNGGAPALWVAISVILVRVLREHGHVMEWTSAISQAVTFLMGFLFIDDTDLVIMGQDASASAEQVAQMMQENVSTWCKSLCHTGGALRPDKCSWCLLACDWNSNGQWKHHTKETLPGDICVPNLQGTPELIERHDPSTATMAVGITQSMDGSMTAQLDILREKAEDWSKSIREGYLPPNLAWSALRQNIWASLKCPLPACNFSPQEADTVLRSFCKTMLPGLRVCRNVPKALRHAPRSFMGLDLPDVCIEQGIGQLRCFTTNAHLPNLLGSLHRACLEQANVEVGIGNVFDASFAKHGFLLTDSLVKSLWQFVSSCDIEISGDIAAPKLQRLGDEYLMRIFVESNLWSKRQLLGMNRVRVDLQVYSVADVSDGEGSHISSWAIGMRKSPDRVSKWRWPREFPGSVDRTAWRQGLSLITDPGIGFDSSRFSLGPWMHNTHRRNWQWRCDPASRILCGCFMDAHWRRCVPRSHCPPRRGSIFRRDGFSMAPPPADTEPATAWNINVDEVRFEGSAPLALPPQPPVSQSLRQLLDTWKHGWPLALSDFPANGAVPADAVRDGTAQGIADGSCKPEQAEDPGAAAWVLEDAVSVRDTGVSPGSCRGMVRTSGTRSEVNACRSELQGAHAMFMAVKLSCACCKITSGSMRLACDNEVTADLAAKDETRVHSN